ncbi:transglutaminase domain-containing protein [uncultured Lacinutrix sp.]|uniref:transglutaminase domain-containing protein n=1 Tax=uncultured Lacinutrix sp. TaxID=574032 RepID=UPI00262FB91D|nr:transglutaminase domain-containing protein [uncultured Lacinutrix sp.]
MKKNYLTALLILTIHFVFSQDYSKIDNIVKYYPKYFYSFENLAEQISNDFDSEIDQVRALYFWVSNNIKYDYDHNLSLKIKINETDSYQSKIEYDRILIDRYAKTCLKENRGVCEGYSLIIKNTLDILNIENKLIKGYAKTGIQDIGNISDIKNHSWNAIKINNTWRLIDATMSTGLTRTNQEEFNFNDNYFLVEPEDLILSHFPKFEEWQLLNNTVERTTFFYAPFFHDTYYFSKLKLHDKTLGLIKVKPNDKISLTFETIDPRKTYLYKFDKDELPSVLTLKKRKEKYITSIIFKKKNNTRLTIYENGNPVISFKIDAI